MSTCGTSVPVGRDCVSRSSRGGGLGWEDLQALQTAGRGCEEIEGRMEKNICDFLKLEE